MPLPEPTTNAELAKLKPKPRNGRGGETVAYPFGHEKNLAMDAKYKGKECCQGERVWGGQGFNPSTFVDDDKKEWAVFVCGACRQPLPLPSAASPVPMTPEERAAVEAKRQAALARRRAREEERAREEKRAREVSAPPGYMYHGLNDWSENGVCPKLYMGQSEYWV